MSKQAKRNSDFLQPKNIREAAAREMIVPDWAKEVPAVEQQESEPAQVATKVEKLAENLKHLGKPGRRETPRRTDGFCTAFAMAVQGGWWGRKVYGVRNKSDIVTPVGELGYSNIPYRDLGDKSNFCFVLGSQKSLSVDFARLSRSALLRWFPVALENTTYSDAITRANVSSNGAIKRGYLVYSIANTRHYSNTTMRDKQAWYLGNKAL